jgi:CheY-like chemotaxis protein
MAVKTAPVTERKRILRVLIIDPNVDDVRRVRDLLQGDGSFVTHASRTVDEARELLEGGMFDVALVDSAASRIGWVER